MGTPYHICMDLPHFPLFPNAAKEGIYEESDLECDFCKQRRGVRYIAGFSGAPPGLCSEEMVVCPWCIADGTAGATGIGFNDATIYGLSSSQMTAEDKELVEQRTPGFVTWQENHWLMCCGRACVYLGEADTGDLQGRWAAAVPSMFEGDDQPQEAKDEIVRQVARGQGPCAYVFECQICHSLKAYWDCH